MACYGVLRGCGERAQRASTYYYIDHGFFGRTKNPLSGEGYYRVIKNALWPESTDDGDDRRLRELGLRVHPWRRTGRHVVVVPPSPIMTQFLGLKSWLPDTLEELTKHTDRDIIVSEKHSAPIAEVLEDAWCVITDHSNAGIQALACGVPAIFTNPVRKLGDISDVENPPMNRSFFTRLANSQWTIDEMRSGACWAALSQP